jgi:GNAT superfamily N-acetyltransferase
MTDNVKIIRLKGHEIAPYVNDLAALRINVFHDYPYLYEGDMEYEKNYLQTYLNCPRSVMVLVLDNNKAVGASTALPLMDEPEYCKVAFRNAGIPLDNIFYFGESILQHAYRGRGIGHAFFKEREAAAREQGYAITAFCGVERPQNHPKKPANWRPLDDFWKKEGYTKHPEIVAAYPWKDIGDKEETEKPMTFWMKTL